MSESRNSGESRESLYNSSNDYNNLEEIDGLIETLEASMQGEISKNPRINKIFSARKKKIEELKRLREQVERKIDEDKEIKELENENREAQYAIDNIKRFLKRNTNSTVRNSSSGESRNSGESRW